MVIHIGLVCGAIDAERVGQIVAEVRGLIVAAVLPRYAHTVNMVGHQAWHFEFGGFGGGENHDFACGRRVVCFPLIHDKFLAPVAKDVGLQTGGGLGPVATRGSSVGTEIYHGDNGVVLCVVGLNVRVVAHTTHASVESLVEGVARPIDAEVYAGSPMKNYVSCGTVVDITCGQRPELKASVGRYEVGRQTAAVVLGRCYLTEYLARGGIMNIVTIGCGLVWHHNLETWAVGA